jgi:hypothetical protein
VTSELAQYLGTARPLIEQDHLIGAYRTLESHDATQSESLLAFTAMGRLLRLRGGYSEACELLRRAVIVSTGCLEAFVELGRSRLSLRMHKATRAPGEHSEPPCRRSTRHGSVCLPPRNFAILPST